MDSESIARKPQLPAEAQVLVIGAGPTGLALATSLALRRIDVAVIDAQSAGANTSRAAVIHARTLETLEGIDVVERLLAAGVRARRFTLRDRDRVLLPVEFGFLPTRYPFTLMVSQAETESILRARLAEAGVDVHWNRALADLRQDADGVEAVLRDGARIRTRYLVGADGAHSTVRDQAGISFPGKSYPQSFALADVRLDGAAPRDEVILYFSPAGLVVVAPLPQGVHRIVATADEAPEQPDSAYVQALLDARGPERDPLRVRELLWSSRFRVHHRVADTLRAGRILIAGDAAHVHSPAGGQGMNTGIQDGIALAEALVRVFATGKDAALDAYEAARLPIAHEVVKLADGLTRIATVPRAMRPLRNAMLRTLARLPAVRRKLAWRLSGLNFRPAAACEGSPVEVSYTAAPD